MKIKTSELAGNTLAAVVGRIEGIAPQFYDADQMWTAYLPHELWEQGGPIIERERIAILSPMTGDFWDARDGKRLTTPFVYWRGPNPLVAAMRCYVASKLGDEVEIPEGLK